jgi:hypothetical protein
MHVFSLTNKGIERGVAKMTTTETRNELGTTVAKDLRTVMQGNRDSHPVYFASPSQLLVVQDNRMTAIDFITN